MSENSQHNHDERHFDPGLLPSQLSVSDLSRTMMDTVDYRLTMASWNIPTDPAEVRGTLSKTSLNDLLLAPGEPLDVNGTEGAYWELPVITPGTDATLSGIDVDTYGTKTERQRLMPTDMAQALAEDNPAFRVASVADNQSVVWCSGKTDWQGKIGLTFWYSRNVGLPIGERIIAQTSHRYPGKLPEFSAQVYTARKEQDAGEVQDADYRIYPRLARPALDGAEVELFVVIAQMLFDKRR